MSDLTLKIKIPKSYLERVEAIRKATDELTARKLSGVDREALTKRQEEFRQMGKLFMSTLGRRF